LLSRYAGPAIAFASICAVAIAITLSITPTDNSVETNNVVAFEIITSNDSLEMYENLEFYLWLDEASKLEKFIEREKDA